MKFCPKCTETYTDESLNFCLNDGTPLQAGAGLMASQQTAVYGTDSISSRPTIVNAQRTQVASSDFSNPMVSPHVKRSRTWIWVVAILAVVMLLCGSGVAGLLFVGSRSAETANHNAAATPTRPTPTPLASFDETPEETPSNEKALTMAQYAKLSKGMSRSEVESILGGSGTQISSTSSDEMTYTVDQWEGNNYSSIIISFQNDKLVVKSQVGLK